MIAALNPIIAAPAEPDPVLALIETHRAAYAAWGRASHAWNHMDPRDPGYETAEAAAEEPGRHEREAMLALLEGRPTTLAGLWALTAYLPEAVRRVNPAPETEAQAALDALRESAQQLGLAPETAETRDDGPEGWIILDARLISLVRELGAIETEQAAILEAGTFADAYDAPDWVRLEGHRESVLGHVIAIRAHTMEGLRAKASLTGLGSVKHAQDVMERLAHSLAADIAGIDAAPSAGNHPDAALLALGLPLLAAWRDEGAADPVPLGAPRDVPPTGTGFEEAAARCRDLTARIAALPAATVEGLGVKALAMAWCCHEIGSPAEPMPKPCGSSTANEWGLMWQIQAGAARILASEAGAAAPSADDTAALALVDAIEREWATYITTARQDRHDRSAEADARQDAAMDRREALLDAAKALPGISRSARHAKALALAWVVAVDQWREGQSREQYDDDGRLALDVMDGVAGNVSPTAAHARPSSDSAATAIDLSGCSVTQLARLHEAFQAAYDHLLALCQIPCFSAGNHTLNPAGEIIEAELDRLGAMVDECVGEIARRDPAPGYERDDALRARVVHELRCNGGIHDPALLRDLAKVWGLVSHPATEGGL